MADISYTPNTWADGSEGGTPIDAAKLNNIESGISGAVAAIGPNDTTADGTLKAQIDALGESAAKINVSGVKSISFDVSANGNRNINFIFYDNHTESLFFNDSSIGLYNSATGIGHGIPWSS